ncbi:nucleotidyltransferase family protein [Pseudogracilibacillus auburnensis]|uniref:nucleotidyltransferase family protein n=1 Tax=Pseudogracilibacillus auburnensis TaxID=1494959 RepID=UPI00363C5C6A
MKACGVIVEYNPFHNGHLYHVQKAKELSNANCMIAIMSGSFLQRGEPAIIDKFHRTKAALASGIDLVIELPYAYAVQSSAFFCKWCCSLFTSFRCILHLFWE